MQLNVLRELCQPIGSVTVADFDEPSLRLDGTVFASLRGSATLLRTDRGLLVSIQGRTSIDTSDGRLEIGNQGVAGH